MVQNTQQSFSYRNLSNSVTSMLMNFFLLRPKSRKHGITILQHSNILHCVFRIKKYLHNSCYLLLCCRCVKVVSVGQELGLCWEPWHACDIMLWWKKSPTVLKCRFYSTLHPLAYFLIM